MHFHFRYIFIYFSFFLFSYLQANIRRGRCHLCDRKKDTKTSAVCDVCIQRTCLSHFVRVCEQCYMKNIRDPSMLSDEVDVSEDENDDNDASTSAPATKRRRTSVLNL